MVMIQKKSINQQSCLAVVGSVLIVSNAEEEKLIFRQLSFML